MEIPLFNGVDPWGWAAKAKRYFQLNDIDERAIIGSDILPKRRSVELASIYGVVASIPGMERIEGVVPLVWVVTTSVALRADHLTLTNREGG